MSGSEAAARTRLSAARTRLILERPFLGALVLYLPLAAAVRCRSLATDGRTLYFSPDFVLSLTLPETQFMLAHEALHCALGHFARRGSRLRGRWDTACDYAVNGLLIDDGMKAPSRVLFSPAYRGLSAEEIYPLVSDGSESATLDEHWFGAGEIGAAMLASGDRPPMDKAFLDAHRDGFEELEFQLPSVTGSAALADTWRNRLAASALEAARAGRLALHWGAVTDAAIEPRLPWRELLDRFLMRVARDDFSFARRSRREGDALLPGMESGEANLVVALDTSGSIPHQALQAFLDEVNVLKGQVRANIALLLCDSALAPGMPLRFFPWEPLTVPEHLPGGGGTRFAPVFDWANGEPVRPDALLYFTDAEGEFPERAPDYPVLWLVMGNAPVPFGERVQLN